MNLIGWITASASSTDADEINDAAPVISEIQVVLSHHNVLSSTKSASQFFSNPWDVGDAENAVVIEARK